MADTVSKVSYVYVTVPNRAGHGAKILREVTSAGVNLFACSGFPGRTGKAQLDLVVPDAGVIRRLAKKNGWRVSETKRAFLIQGDDKVGAVSRHVQKLAKAKIDVTAADAVSAGRGRYGMILWVKPKNFARAAAALKAR